MYLKAVSDWQEFSGSLERYFRKAREEQSFNVCQVPQFLEKAGYPVREWEVDLERQEVMLDFRTSEQIEAMKKNQHGTTLGLNNWRRRPLLVQKVVTSSEWKSSVHHFGGKILFTVGLDKKPK